MQIHPESRKPDWPGSLCSWFFWTCGKWVFVAAGLLLLFSMACTPREKRLFSEEDWAEQVRKTRVGNLYAPHHDGRAFFAPWMRMPNKSVFDLLNWKLFSENQYSPEQRQFLPAVLPDTATRLDQTRGDFILWIGHNTFLIRIRNVYWLIDPVFSRRALLPARVTPPALTLADLNSRIKSLNIVISHNHYDHLDRKTMEQLPQNASVYVPLGLKSYVMDMNKKNVQEMDWWEEISVGEDSRLVCLPAQHWSLRINQGKNESLWASWLLITPETTFYFGGDSGYFKGFREIGRKYPKIDYAFMATTAYHPRWFMHYQHMDVREAIQAFEELGACFFIPTQWGTFHLGSEPAGFPGLELKEQIQKGTLSPIRFKIMDIGQILPVQHCRTD